MKKAFITGITGQDGSYLAELLLSKDYEVHGLVRLTSHKNPMLNILHIKDSITLHTGNVCDYNSIVNILKQVEPDEIYHLGASTHVGESFKIPQETIMTNAVGSFNVLEAARCTVPSARIYNASTSEMFGSAPIPSDEYTYFHPNSSYATAKVFAYHQAVHYREAHNMFICSGILFNHESPRRGEEFVTRKITKAVARLSKNKYGDKLCLGNLNASRDWGYAPDFVKAMWMMLQHNIADDYVVCSGEMHSLYEFLEIAFNYAHMNWKEFVEYDAQFVRPKDNDVLLGNYSKIKRVLGWEPSISFEDLVCKMVHADMMELIY